MKWLIDSCMPDNLDKLKATLGFYGIEYIETKYLEVVQKATGTTYNEELFVYGSSCDLNPIIKEWKKK